VWIEVARTVARRSLCSRAQVGAVIVTAGNRVVATGYNGPPAGFMYLTSEPLGLGETCEHWCERGRASFFGTETPTAGDYSDCPSLHAEANALMAADRSTWQDGTIYVLGDVCHACAKLIANSGLARVVVQRDAIDRSYRTSETGYDLLRACGLSLLVLDHDHEGDT